MIKMSNLISDTEGYKKKRKEKKMRRETVIEQ